MRIFPFVTAFAALTVFAVPALPCSIDGCRDGELGVVMRQVIVPGFSLPGQKSQATVPANIPAILWRLNEEAYTIYTDIPDPAHVLLSSSGGEKAAQAFEFFEGIIPEQVDFLDRRTLVLVPKAPLMPQTTHLIADMGLRENRCGMPEFGSFRTSGTAALPTTLGTLELPATVSRYISSSSVDYVSTDVPNPAWMDLEIEDDSMCTVYIGAAMAFVKFVPSADALPWQDALYYRLYVDDKPWIYHPQTPMDIHDLLGLDATWSTVFAYCGAPVDRCHKWYPFDAESAQEWQTDFEDMRDRGMYDVMDPGVHRVRLQAWLPGTDIVLQTPEIEIDIQCPERIEEDCPNDDDDDVIGDVESPADAAGDAEPCQGATGGCQAGGLGGGAAGNEAGGAAGGMPMAWLILLAGVIAMAAVRFTESRRALRRIRNG